MNFRKENLDAFVKKYGIKLGFMSIFSKASAYALQDQPVVNAVIDGQVKNSIEKKQTTCGIRAKFNQFNCNILSIFGTGLSRIWNQKFNQFYFHCTASLSISFVD